MKNKFVVIGEVSFLIGLILFASKPLLYQFDPDLIPIGCRPCPVPANTSNATKILSCPLTDCYTPFPLVILSVFGIILLLVGIILFIYGKIIAKKA